MVFFCTDQDCGYFILLPRFTAFCSSFFLFFFFFFPQLPFTQIPLFHLCASLPSFQICSCCMLSCFLLTGPSARPPQFLEPTGIRQMPLTLAKIHHSSLVRQEERRKRGVSQAGGLSDHCCSLGKPSSKTMEPPLCSYSSHSSCFKPRLPCFFLLEITRLGSNKFGEMRFQLEQRDPINN